MALNEEQVVVDRDNELLEQQACGRISLVAIEGVSILGLEDCESFLEVFWLEVIYFSI